MAADERELIRAFKRGSAEALAAIYDRYAGLLLKVAGGLLHDRAEAEDVVHDTFVKFAQSADRLRLQGSLKAYLITCVTHRVRDRYRQKAVSAGAPAEPEAMSPETAVMEAEAGRLVQLALAQLPDEQREAVVLHVQGDLTFRETAGMLGISINTAQSRCRYGMEKLRHLLDGESMP